MRDNNLLDGKDDFVVFTPSCVDIIDLSKGSADELERFRPIGGVCSTERLDRQDESVFAKGLCFREFVEHGYFNDNHKQDTAAVVGWPALAELRKGRWWTEGNLLQDWEPANRIWLLAKSLRKSTIARRLGFSIEGKVRERAHDGRILKAIIRHVAITNSPVNVDCTWDILAKAFGSFEEVEAGVLRRSLGARTVQREDQRELSFNEGVMAIQKLRGYSWSTCERLARIIYKQQEQLRRN
jgi:hypothetical protein